MPVITINAQKKAEIDSRNSSSPEAPSEMVMTDMETGEVNATNARQNQIADASNTNGTKLQALITIVKDIAQKLNLTFDTLEDNKLLASA